MFFMQFSTFVVIIITNTVYIAVIEYTYHITHTALIGLVNIKVLQASHTNIIIFCIFSYLGLFGYWLWSCSYVNESSTFRVSSFFLLMHYVHIFLKAGCNVLNKCWRRLNLSGVNGSSKQMILTFWLLVLWNLMQDDVLIYLNVTQWFKLMSMKNFKGKI